MVHSRSLTRTRFLTALALVVFAGVCDEIDNQPTCCMSRLLCGRQRMPHLLDCTGLCIRQPARGWVWSIVGRRCGLCASTANKLCLQSHPSCSNLQDHTECSRLQHMQQGTCSSLRSSSVMLSAELPEPFPFPLL